MNDEAYNFQGSEKEGRYLSFFCFCPVELVSQRDSCVAEKRNCPVEVVADAVCIAGNSVLPTRSCK